MTTEVCHSTKSSIGWISGQSTTPLTKINRQKASLLFWEQHLPSRITLAFAHWSIFKVFLILISIISINFILIHWSWFQNIRFNIYLATLNYSLLYWMVSLCLFPSQAMIVLFNVQSLLLFYVHGTVRRHGVSWCPSIWPVVFSMMSGQNTNSDAPWTKC